MFGDTYILNLGFLVLPPAHSSVRCALHHGATALLDCGKYIRLRFNATISLAACAIYIFFTQSIGAISIFAASLTLVTVFKTPLFWCNIFIGLSGTLYTVLGGLRGVVWTDCMQFVIALLAPMAVVAKMFIDASAPNSTIQPLTGTDVARYMANYSFDLTNDETIWACSLGTSAMAIYRVCWDQVVAQRLLASRTLKDAQRTAQTSALLLVLIYFTGLFLGVALTVWFRGCDPTLLGEISSIDQIVPYYINTYLMDIPGFSGLFLAGIVSAATSTVSSTVNSQAAILHVDVIAPRYKNAENHVLWITRGTALVLGILMTIYSMLCAHMGSVTRAFLMVYNGITAPFVGLCLLAVLFPFVHSKGAGVATLSMIIYQLCHITTIIRSGRRPPRMAASLDSCPGNESSIVSAINATFVDTHRKLEESFVLFRMSYLWTSFFAIFATLIIGVAVSAVTGEMKNVKWQYHLCCGGAVTFWRKLMALCREEKVQGAITPNKNGEQHSQIQEIEKLVPNTIETNI
ncbi:sodium-coupled monocarboxylate transporter 2-like isoform X2 [Dermacentor variabilis]|uniref:sodium-coupled monocarboxylate transporter 2-like isoform X2 n=1 Tax=Dermacentor variabilis TaxID=34621 RepID=UPI003F5B1283